MLRGKFLSKCSSSAVRTLLAAGVFDRSVTTVRRFSGAHCLHCSTSISVPPLYQNVEAKQVHASCSGFPKNMHHGPSTVLDQGVFGDDACFLARFKNTFVVGVADGVGGWRNYGIDPSEFSDRLMKICALLVNKGEFVPEKPDELLAKAYKMLAEPPCPVGSSTACVVIIDHDTLYSANLGDSGFIVIRNHEVVYRSQEMTHYFNAPFQLALPPANASSEGFLGDSPENAESASMELSSGDVVLIATDGLWDNVPDEKILEQLVELKPGNVQQVCNSLALTARRLAFDSDHKSPFTVKASKHGIDANGGKPDDITLIVLLIA